MGCIVFYKIGYVWLMGHKSKNMLFRFAQYEVKSLLGKMAGFEGMFHFIGGMWVVLAFILILCGWGSVGNNTMFGFIVNPNLEVCVITGLAMCWKVFAIIAVYRITLGHTYWKLNAVIASVFLVLFLWRLLRFVPMMGSPKLGAIVGPVLVLIIFMIEAMCICKKKAACEADIDRMNKMREYIGKNPEFNWADGATGPDGFDGAAAPAAKEEAPAEAPAAADP